MIKLKDLLIMEGLELPGELEKTLTDIFYSGVAHLISKKYDNNIKNVKLNELLDGWKKLKSPIKREPVSALVNPAEYYVTLLYRDSFEGFVYNIKMGMVDDINGLKYFNNMSGYNEISSIFILLPEYKYNPERFKNTDDFLRIVKYDLSGHLHEGRHLLQAIRSNNSGLHIYGTEKGDPSYSFYGQPKAKLMPKFDKSVRGIDNIGRIDPDKNKIKKKDFSGQLGKYGSESVPHSLQTVEYKTDLHTVADSVKYVLSSKVSGDKWNDAFKDLIQFGIGKMSKGKLAKKYGKFDYTDLDYLSYLEHLKPMYKYDKPKFKQFIKELYKIVFSSKN